MRAPLSPSRITAALTGAGALVGTVALILATSACGSRVPDTKPTDLSPITEPTEAYTGAPWFRDVTEASGVRATCRNGEEADQFTILESLGTGVALFDFDGDGRLDIFVVGGGYFDGPTKTDLKGHPCKLYRNLGNMKFEDVTSAAGLAGDWWYTHGVAVADYDRDGFPDFVVTGYGRIGLFHNEPNDRGGRRFVDVSEKLGLRDSLWGTSAAWGDLDGDGYPELYVCHYTDWSFTNNPICKGTSASVPRDVCVPQRFKPLVHSLFKNDRGQKFRDTASEQHFKPDGYGLGVVIADLNADGRPDVYVANDAARNFLLFNRGGALEEKGVASGTAVDDGGQFNGSMGVDVVDYDGSGRAALWVTNYQGELHALYHNLGAEMFDHRSRLLGVGSIGVHRVGFGTAFTDLDHDGWEDVVVANGHVLRNPAGSSPKQQPVLFHNTDKEGRRFFRDISNRGGPYFQAQNMARGLALGDLDNDGHPDLVVTQNNGPVVILRNEAPAPHPWVGIKLVGKGNRDVVGSTVTVELDGRKLTRFVKGGGSYLSANDPRLHFGLGGATIKRVTVRWSWGESQSWENVDPGAYWELTEGQPTAKRLPAS
ncbi:FG-GAP repeat protein [Gemmata sp. SH-PL17]|uniref:CRTAC1 family protein n=1 Tax=Gemmata sp. SH-PL17 TaxID=1630693 RepID=UPI00078B57D3|nr:CRTAC1 family protein [Gemmata sp. SH-PL17]AMV29155.1 FG-GAP repeat protein [Gemmata sp. SH-PL17]